MRLLIATPLYPPEAGGPATYAKTLADGLPSLGTEVSLVKYSEVRHRPRGIRHLVYAWMVFREARKSNLVLALDPVSVGLPALIAARLARKPFVVKIVGDYAWEQGRQRFKMWLPLDEFVRTKDVPLAVHILRRVETFVANQADAIIVPSAYLKGIVTAWGVNPAKISVIANAKPLASIGTVPEVVERLAHPRIVSAGRLVPWKGMHGLIAAMVSIREKEPNAELIIIGDGPERAALERYASARLPKGCTFTGALPHDETLAAIAASDIFVLNSTYEGLSHLLLEALELGKAIVTTRAGGNPEVIQHGENGLLISVGDNDALSDACLSILADKKGREALETAAKASAERYTPERMLGTTNTLLSSFV